MKSGSIYIRKRLTDSRLDTYWHTVKEKKYNSVAQRKKLMKAMCVQYLVNNINIVISVMPR